MPFLPTQWNATPRLLSDGQTCSAEGTIPTVNSDMSRTRTDRSWLALSQTSLPCPQPTPRLSLVTNNAKTTGRQESPQSASTSSSRSVSGKRKKASDVFGFLTLKEPSTTAWEDFARKQKEQAAKKTGRPSVTVIPGVSSQKLPSHVPKVNSKWDGLPESTNNKNAPQKQKNGSKSPSTYSVDSRRNALYFRSNPSSASSSVRQCNSNVDVPAGGRLTRLKSQSQSIQDVTPPSRSKQRVRIQSGHTAPASPSQTEQDGVRTTFLFPPSPLPSSPLDADTQHQSDLNSTFLLAPSVISPCPSFLDEATDTLATLNLTEQYADGLVKRRQSNENMGTFWISDSDDGTLDKTGARRTPSQTKVHQASFDNHDTLIDNTGTFFIEDDQVSARADPPKTLGYQTSTNNCTSSSLSDCTTQSAASESIFSTDCFTASRPSTNASSVAFHTESPLHDSSHGLSVLSPAALSRKEPSSRTRPTRRSQTNKAEVLPWELHEPPNYS